MLGFPYEPEENWRRRKEQELMPAETEEEFFGEDLENGGDDMEQDVEGSGKEEKLVRE